MKNTLKLFIALFAISVTALTANAEEKKSKETQTVTFIAKAIDCDHCKQTIMKSIPYEKGVKDVKVDIKKQEVTVAYRGDKNSPEKLNEALTKIGYPSTVKPCCASKCSKTSDKKECSKSCSKECTKSCDKKECSKSCSKECTKSCDKKECSKSCDKKTAAKKSCCNK